MKPLVTILIILAAVAGCAGTSADYAGESQGMRAHRANSSSSDCRAAGGATWDALTGICIGAQR